MTLIEAIRSYMIQGLEKHFDHSCKPGSADGVCRTRGGESCAFDGAMIVLQCIADAAHLVHGPIACLGNSWEGRGTVSDKGVLHRRAFTTDLRELDIIYGAEEKLLAAIRCTFEDSRPKAIFVYSTCVTGLIGEDLRAVCKKAASEIKIPVIPVDAPGFIGPKNLGNRIAGDVLIEHVIGTGEPPLQTPADIALIGEYNIAGDLECIEPLFRRAGIRILSHITGNSTYEEITCAHRAKASAVVCSRALINVARELEERYSIPFSEVSFFGKTEMSRALRSVALMLEPHAPGVGNRVENLILMEEARLEERLERFSSLRGKRAVLYTGGVKSWSIISALMDLGIEVVAVGTKKSTYEDEEKMRMIMGPDAPLHENMTPKTILSLVKKHSADMVIAGGRNLYLAIKEGIPFVDVNQERHRPYAGYDGLVNLAEEIDSSIRFYERTGTDSAVPGRRPVTTPVKTAERGVTINPLKHSMSIGAAMALQGIDRALVVMHGAQGCNFLGKVLITGHYREPVSLIGSKLFVEDVVLGSDEQLLKTIREAVEKDHPAVVGVLTSGLSEVRGEDVGMALSALDVESKILHIPTPDYKGGLEEGYNAAVEALVSMAAPGRRNERLVNVLAGSALTPGDINEIREIISDFGLEPLVLPDLSAMDGSRSGFGPLASGGTDLSTILSMGSASVTIAVGAGMAGAARSLNLKCGVPSLLFESLTGLQNTDRFFREISRLSGLAVPEKYARQRRILVDGMRDAATIFGGARVALALESEKAVSISSILHEMGAAVPLAVIPVQAEASAAIIADSILTGDFGHVAGSFDLLIAGSHGASTAAELGIDHMEWGFPAIHELGYQSSVCIGYRGTMNLLCSTGNRLRRSHHQYSI